MLRSRRMGASTVRHHVRTWNGSSFSMTPTRLIGDRRGDHNRLGFVLQATTVRYLGVFLEDPLDVPWAVVEYLAAQLGIADASCAKRYTARAKTAYEHASEIRDAYGFRVFEDREAAAEFGLFLEGRA